MSNYYVFDAWQLAYGPTKCISRDKQFSVAIAVQDSHLFCLAYGKNQLNVHDLNTLNGAKIGTIEVSPAMIEGV